MLTEIASLTGYVVTAKIAVLAPAATATEVGTVATDALLPVRFTTIPPAGAAALSVTVPVADPPPNTEVGFSVTPARVRVGVMLRFEKTESPAYVADMTTVVAVETLVVFTVKVAAVAPCGTVTLAANVVSLVSLVVSFTSAPPVGAGPLRLTVPVDELPPITLEGAMLKEEILMVEPVV